MADHLWQKTSYSAAHDDCVEIRTGDQLIEIRESDDGETILRATPAAAAALLRAIKSGELDQHA
ncbi:DUF397 domain-containing protein [Kitasatospora purpeofusca]|uniref:DUF397 domain-containing protein n=1 Tax=Kitasatospora purpeofusca TaxID=67352 RepID=UPI00225C2D45|nr:DUF397 domain-containing protein [Kitasatospora purpeofusca]MCX4754343.1 DUF397 domain-containing protein [Kitasatospora purpeofusca]WSR33771.1 DUF397 domain-containing protein [Kitasatospora purpeofusca]